MEKIIGDMIDCLKNNFDCIEKKEALIFLRGKFYESQASFAQINTAFNIYNEDM